MNESNRRGAVSLGLGIAFAAASAGRALSRGIAHADWRGATTATQPELQSKPNRRSTRVWAAHGGGPGTYQYICDYPADRTDADLCQQWRTAEAAQWTIVQVFLSLAGLIGLVATVLFAKRAAEAGRDATIAVEKAYVANNRPWLIFEAEGRLEDTFVKGEKFYVSINLKVTNKGRSPAFDVKGRVQAYPLDGEWRFREWARA